MPKQIIIAEQYRTAAVFSEDQIEEIIVATGTHQVGDVYMGVVENILTSIDAAFVNIGDNERNGFIHITDLGPLKLRRSGSSINDLLSPQQRVLVQVMKEPTGNKGPRLTGNVSMPGRYVVLMPFGRGVNLSRRIKSEAERSRLRALAVLIKPAGMGLLVRTEAEGVSEDSIIEDLDSLQRQWEGIQQESSTIRFPSLLDRENDFVQRVLRDAYSNDINRIVTDTSDGLRRVKQHLLNWGEGKIPPNISIDHHRERTPILEYFRVNAAIREALRPRVDLPSGGYIVIEPTEALTVIDVNSGSNIKARTSRETVLWTNCEAAIEVARQIRLRNIAGVIVVDFIDMDTRRDQLQLLESFEKSLRADKSRPQIAQLTELGLVELTRKRQGQSIYELFGRPCATCNGHGILAQLPGEAPQQVTDMASSHWEERFSPKLDLESEEADGSLSGGSEANLVYHPNYQERGNGSRRRRRNVPPGRSSREQEGSNREVSRENGRDSDKTVTLNNDKTVILNAEGRSRPEPRTEPRVEPRTEPRAERTESRVAVLPAEKVAVLEAEEVAVKTPEPSERRGKPRPKLEVTETIVVEMTPEEQEVYAHMGISPLVFVDRDAKDLRNIIVAVTLPGQAPPVIPTKVSAASQATNPAAVSASVETVGEAVDVISYDSDREVDTAIIPEFAFTEPVTEPVTSSSTPETDSEEGKEIIVQSPAASRRRRRTVSD